MPVYPGDPDPGINPFFQVSTDGFAVTIHHIPSHAGTHVDAPAHLQHSGKSLGDFGLDRYWGRGLNIRVPADPDKAVLVRHLAIHADLLAQVDFLLLQTGWDARWARDDYFDNHPFLDLETAVWLAGFPLKGLGLDFPSPDKPGDEKLPVHREWLGRDRILIENLTGLDRLPETGFFFSCLPLKVEIGDGFPVRAAGIIGETWQGGFSSKSCF